MTPTQKLWLALLEVRISDAIYPFKIPAPEIPNLKEQFKKLRSKKFEYARGRKLEAARAIYWLETDNLDKTVEAIGYDSLYVNKTCEFVQEALTLRKKLINLHSET